MSTKGSWPRPCSVTREEKNLRLSLMYGEITEAEFNKRYKVLKRKGLIKRDGRTVT